MGWFMFFNKAGLLFVAFCLYGNVCSARAISDINAIEKWMRGQDIKNVEKCAEEGEQRCQVAMGMYYSANDRFFFNSREKNKLNSTKSKKWLQNNLGKSAVARTFMANKLLEDNRRKEGRALLESAALEGNYEALRELTMGDIGVYDDVEQERQQTFFWRQKLYDQFPGGLEAYNVAAGYFSRGDCKLGVDWIERSAFLHDNLIAQEFMGSLYEQGYCLPQNNIMAYMMYDLGGTGASDKKQAIAQKMTPEEIDEATRRSHDWQDEHHSYRPSYGSGASIYWNVH